MFRKIFAAILLVFTFGKFSCQESNVPSISFDELAAGSNVVILDVRQPAELESALGKIDGAINIPLPELEERLSELDQYKDKTIAVICRSGNRSVTATEILLEAGYNAKNLPGGMIHYRKWEEENEHTDNGS